MALGGPWFTFRPLYFCHRPCRKLSVFDHPAMNAFSDCSYRSSSIWLKPHVNIKHMSSSDEFLLTPTGKIKLFLSEWRSSEVSFALAKRLPGERTRSARGAHAKRTRSPPSAYRRNWSRHSESHADRSNLSRLRVKNGYPKWNPGKWNP